MSKATPPKPGRLSKDIYTLLNQRLADVEMSFAEFVKESLGILQAKMHDIGKIRKTARQSGYNKALKDWQIWHFCNMCKEQIIMRPNDNDHKAMIKFMREHGWGHKSCHGD